MFTVGTIIKGSALRGKQLIKILSNSLRQYNFQYKIGKNTDILPFNPRGMCLAGGLYFTTIDNIFEFLLFGNKIAYVEVDDDEDIYVVKNEFKARTLTITKIEETFDNVILSLKKEKANR